MNEENPVTDIASLISQLTLEEKAALCTGAGPWTTTPVERLNIRELVVADGPHGIRRLANLDEMASKSLPATCFPTAALLSATWDTELLRQIGEAIGEEARALEVDVVLGPGNNMKRTPLCGRNFEYFSEDPYLSGELAASYIEGVQSKGVGTSLKHYAVNNQEMLCSMSSPCMSWVEQFLVPEHTVDNLQDFRHTCYQSCFPMLSVINRTYARKTIGMEGFLSCRLM